MYELYLDFSIHRLFLNINDKYKIIVSYVPGNGLEKHSLVVWNYKLGESGYNKMLSQKDVLESE